jgi:hypothetical protein
MATMKLGNNCNSRMANSLSVGATSLSITAGDGAKFPVLGAGDWHPLTLVKLVGGMQVLEIVKATARAGDVFTIERGQENTTATDFSAGDRVELRFTAAAFDEAISGVQQVTEDAQAAIEQSAEEAQEAINNASIDNLARLHAIALSF